VSDTNKSTMQSFQAADGTNWGVQVQLPGGSNAIVVFHHPDGRTARKDRYVTLNWHGPEANQVTKNVDPAKMLATLDDKTVRDLFTRSVLIGGGRPAFSPA
jgi:hypothetical protein